MGIAEIIQMREKRAKDENLGQTERAVLMKEIGKETPT